MSGGWPVTDDAVFIDTSADSVTNMIPGPNITPDNAANTKGSYTTVLASTAGDASMMAVVTRVWGDPALSVDIAIGAAASEQIIAADLVYYTKVNISDASRILIPCQIPAGTRISARAASSKTGPVTPIAVGVVLFNNGILLADGCAGVDAIGFDAANTRGTSVTTNATALVKGSYAQLIASTAQDYRGFFLSPDQSAGSNTDMPTFWDIAFGAGGSEVIFLPDEYFRGTGTGHMGPLGPNTYHPIPIPSGTRIAARVADQSGAASQYQMTMYGVY